MAKDETFDRNALALEYGLHYKIPKLERESDDDYRVRLSGELRTRGDMIESHEVFSGRRYDDPEQGSMGLIAGIFGAMAQELSGKKFSSHDPERQIGDDLALGVVIRDGGKADDALGKIFGVLGPEAGMDLLDSHYKRDRK
ncbi:MAG: hypothetical protein AABW91_01905 [Nanoarchaeota archaeon]